MSSARRFFTAGGPASSALAGLAIGAFAGTATAQTPVPVRVDESGGGSVVLRAEFRSAPNLAMWPSPSSLVPLYDAWEIGYASLRGEGTTRLPAGQSIDYREGALGGPATARSEASLSMLHVAKKWTGGLPNGDELEGFLGLGVSRMNLSVRAGGNLVEPTRNAPGLVLGFGYRSDLPGRMTLEARIALQSSNPLYWFGSHDYMSGLTTEAMTADIGIIWPRGGNVALHAGLAGVRFVPDREKNESLSELRLWGPFLGIQVALR